MYIWRIRHMVYTGLSMHICIRYIDIYIYIHIFRDYVGAHNMKIKEI